MFKTMTLEPVLDPRGPEGYIDGMRIAVITAGNPLAKAGFRSGDRLVSFDGVPLRDPAEIAYLFADLSGQFEVCAERVSGLHCRLVSGL
ncbi:MAG: hypothetical protein HUJ31_08035 [Pseudomonadales bacterium]|nr:hypothetical protein [Pseudomonadales bacterium]